MKIWHLSTSSPPLWKIRPKNFIQAFHCPALTKFCARYTGIIALGAYVQVHSYAVTCSNSMEILGARLRLYFTLTKITPENFFVRNLNSNIFCPESFFLATHPNEIFANNLFWWRFKPPKVRAPDLIACFPIQTYFLGCNNICTEFQLRNFSVKGSTLSSA